MMNKNTLRAQYKTKRLQLDNNLRDNYNNLLAQQLTKILFLSDKNILLYKAIAKFQEPPVEMLIANALLTAQGYQLLYPKVDPLNNNFEAVIPFNNEFYVDIFGIDTPISGTIVQATLIDIVFVPLLIFDKKGYRVGYGKGMYDKYLVNCKPTTIKVGVSYFEPIDHISDIHDGDIKLDLCVCPHSIYTF